jgi:anti-sigma factor RsiW
MKCPLETRETEVLLAYSSCKLDAAAGSLVASHVESCPACREFVQAQQVVWDALDAWEAAPVSADFDRRLFERIDRQVSWFDRLVRPFQSFGLRRVIPIAASAGLVLMAGLLVQQTSVAPQAPRTDNTAQMEAPPPEQLVLALDEMDALSQLSRPLHADKADSEM